MITLVGAALWVAVAGEVASDAPPRHAGLDVVADIEGDGDEFLRQRILACGDAVLRRAAVLPARDGDDPTIAIHVEDDDESNYTFELRTSRAGEPAGEPTTGTCRLCTEGELVAAVEERLVQVVAALGAATEPTPAPMPSVPARAAAPAPVVDASRRRLGKLGIAGVSSLVAGVAIAATGIGLVLAPDRDAADPRYDVSTRPVGWALVGVGAAGSVVGAVLLGLDRRTPSRRRRVALTMGHRTVAIGVHGRF